MNSFNAQPEAPAHLQRCRSQCRRLRLGVKRTKFAASRWRFVLMPVGHFLLAAAVVCGSVCEADDPSFQREIRPILSEHCFRCHGFDENSRKAQLRLDHFEGATHPAESGSAAIVPSWPDESELIRRITSSDPDVRMPPSDSGKTLSAEQIESLRRWIGKGARYEQHWAFERPVSRPLPDVRQQAWPRNVIDAFVLSYLEQAGLSPREEAAPARLLRRVSLDLIGLPPTPEELDHFQQAISLHPDSAYEAEVDRLLNSPHFGERMAIDWLDAARYADTNGYFGDRARQAWPWRDWVIRAFNDNMPFDQFTIEQLAGDLLPEATLEQRVATGFHRNSMANNETGIIDEEYRVEAVADRVDTTATVWLAMTIGCAQCHDHKFDPISQSEYYELFAYFNNSVETGLVTSNDPPPAIEVPSDAQKAAMEMAQSKLREAEQSFLAVSATLDADLATWESGAATELTSLPEDTLVDCHFDAPLNGASDVGASIIGTSLQYERGIRGNAASFDATQHVEISTEIDVDRPWTISVWLKPSSSLGCVWSKIEPTDSRRGVEMIWQKGRLQINLVHDWGTNEIVAATKDAVSSGEWHHALVSYDGTQQAAGLHVVIDGLNVPLSVHRETLTGSLQCKEPTRIGRRDSGLGYYGLLDEFRILQRVASAAEMTGWSDSERLRGILARATPDRSSADQTTLRDYYVTHRSPRDLRESYQRLQKARGEESAARAAIPTALVMQELTEPRKTHLLVRGQYNQPAAEVQPGVPAVFPSLSNEAPLNRLTLARWLVTLEHPLTARVAVNRWWQMCFGEGLVRTPNDFGTQGELPTHPELLDELAVRFVDSGWKVKDLLRLIVTSSTYRQSSQPSQELLLRDPGNRLLGSGPRFRLSGELLRDQALVVSGLLVPRIGGPSVKPYQPEGLWEAVSYNAEDSYVPDEDGGLWRRSLYTYWKRQAPPPALLMFDAGTREKCVVRRSRTNTPLQALVVLNDVTYVEAARALAARTLTSGGDDTQLLRAMFRRVVSRWPESAELHVLKDLLIRQRQAFRADPEAADRLITSGASQQASSIDHGELAAWTLVAQTIMNLDEVITRR